MIATITEQELRRFYLFASLTDQQLSRIKHTMRRLQFGDGEYLFEYGQPAERFFVVLSGHVKLIRISFEGDEKVIEIISPGESFAEAIMFMSQQVYPVTAQVVGKGEILSFENKVFLSILEESFDTCRRLLCDMSMRLRRWLNEIDNLTLQNATYRLVNYLLCQVPTDHKNSDCQIKFTLPKHVIASRLSIKPETLSRILHQMTEEGLINVTGRTIHIHDINNLRMYCNE